MIRARGADAATFLQGQLTNDVAQPRPGRGAAGRLLLGQGPAAGQLRRLEGRPTTSSCSPARADLLAPTLKRLSMFVLRAKCKLSDASAEIALFGVAGSAATARLGDARRRVGDSASTTAPPSIRLPDAAGMARACSLRRRHRGDVAPRRALTLATWRWLEVRSGIVTIEAATVDRFVPQMVNFELLGGVDFQKGCYPGQEVVARSQYRGTTKRRTFLFESDAVASAGAGRVPSPAPRASRPARSPTRRRSPQARGGSALVEVRLAALGDGELRLGAADGRALRRAALPYAVPLDAEPPPDGLNVALPDARALRLLPRRAAAPPKRARAVDALQRSACGRRMPGLQARLLRRAGDGEACRPGWKPTRCPAQRRRRAGIDAAIEAAIAPRHALAAHRRAAPRRGLRAARRADGPTRSEHAQHLDVGDAGLVELRPAAA